MQLGPDQWFDSVVDGRKVKNMRRRMALFPEDAGTLWIGAFTHRLTLTDAGDDWFDHEITSAPVEIEVRPHPPTDDWWLPVRRIEVSDNWSNAPDQLAAGEGVLRVIRIEAVGIPPDLLPPMPDLKSPSALIFPHPEKRLVTLSPEGPVSVAFWRWTILPARPPSAILEPIKFEYYDTVAREMRSVTISAQRVATTAATAATAAAADRGKLHRGSVRIALRGRFAAGAGRADSRSVGRIFRRSAVPVPPLAVALAASTCGRGGRPGRPAPRARALLPGAGSEDALLDRLETAIFSRDPERFDARAFRRDLLRRL